MPAPELNDFATLLYDRLEPLAYADSTQSYSLAHLCQAIGIMYEDLYDVLGGDNPWSVLFDVENIPLAFLPFLAQFLGARIPAGSDEETARSYVRTPSGLERGTVASIVAATQRTLTGGKNVVIIERQGGNAYDLLIHTRVAETPDAAATEASIITQKPAGIILSYVVSDDEAWDEAVADWDDVPGRTWASVSDTDPI